MSKTLAILKELEEERLNRSKQEAHTEIASTREYSPNVSQLKTPIVFIFVLAIVITILFGFNLKLFFLMENLASEKNNTLMRLAEMERLINNNTQQASVTNMNVKQLSAGIEQMQKDADSQAFKIETLIKAKNTLFNKISELEAKLDKAGGTK